MFALDANVLLDRDERDARLCEAVKDGDALAERPSEPGEFAHGEAFSGLEDSDHPVEPAVFRGGLPPCRCLDEVVDLEAVFAGIFENGEALAACVLPCGRKIGNGFHALPMQWLFHHFT